MTEFEKEASATAERAQDLVTRLIDRIATYRAASFSSDRWMREAEVKEILKQLAAVVPEHLR